MITFQQNDLCCRYSARWFIYIKFVHQGYRSQSSRPQEENYFLLYLNKLPSVLWRCWLGGRKGIRPVKNWLVRCWHGYLSGVRCRLAYGPADTTATHCPCFSKIQIGFTFLVPVHLGSPGQRAVKRVSLYLNKWIWNLENNIGWEQCSAKRYT